VANISDWPPEQIEALRAVLKGDLAGVGPLPEVESSLPHGHVAAVLGTARHLGMEKLLSKAKGFPSPLKSSRVTQGIARRFRPRWRN
jgi:hypothetical protein